MLPVSRIRLSKRKQAWQSFRPSQSQDNGLGCLEEQYKRKLLVTFCVMSDNFLRRFYKN